VVAFVAVARCMHVAVAVVLCNNDQTTSCESPVRSLTRQFSTLNFKVIAYAWPDDMILWSEPPVPRLRKCPTSCLTSMTLHHKSTPIPIQTAVAIIATPSSIQRVTLFAAKRACASEDPLKGYR
jgi:hypothetical protein